MAAPTIALSGTGLVHVRSYGATGLAGLSVRGGGPSQVAVVLNGFALTNAQLGQFDLSLLPGAMVSRIEILPGGASALYGSSAVSGAIRISTEPVHDARIQLTSTLGAFGERAGVVAVAAVRGRVAVSGSFRMAETDGDYPYVNTASFPASDSRRENADRSEVAGHLDVSAGGANLKGSLGLLALTARRGLPAVAGALATGDRQHDQLVRITGFLQTRYRDLNAEAAALVEHSGLRYISTSLGQDQLGVVRRFALRMSVETAFPDDSSLRVVAEADRGAARHPALSGEATRTNVSIAATGITELVRFKFFPAARLDGYDTAGRQRSIVFTPRLGMSFRPTPDHPVSVTWNLGRAFRMPTLNDLFWVGPDARGRLDLTPERSWSTEVGASVSGNAADAQVSVFGRRTIDQIVWAPDGRGLWMPVNLGTVRALGVQAGATMRAAIAAASLSSTVGYTYTHARETSLPEPARLRYVPAHEGHLSIRASTGSGLFAELDLHGSGIRNVTIDQLQTLPPYVTADVKLGVRYDGRWSTVTVRLDIRNVGDARYSVVEGYPMPPRHIRLITSFSL